MQLTRPRACGEREVTGCKASVLSKARVDREQRIVTAIANTAAIDMDDEVVIPEGAPSIGKAYFDSAKTIYLNHDYSGLNSIGKMRNRKLAGGEHVVQFHVTERTQLGRDVFALLDEGIINGVSIGFEARDRGEPTDDEVAKYGPASIVTREWDWIELSVTSMPCNPAAMIQAIEGGSVELEDDKAAQVDEMVCKGMIDRASARAIGLRDRKVFTLSSGKVLDLGPSKKVLSI